MVKLDHFSLAPGISFSCDNKLLSADLGMF